MDKLEWIHLSDVHFSGNEGYEIRRMRDSIINKLKEIIADRVISFVVVSGDLVYQNGTYDSQLKKFLDSIMEICNITKDNLFIVPGNHDLKRNQPRTLLLNGIRKDNFKFEHETMKQLQKDFKKYKTFMKKMGKDDGDYIYKLEKRKGYNLFLMNTAFTAGTDADDGNLIRKRLIFWYDKKIPDYFSVAGAP